MYDGIVLMCVDCVLASPGIAQADPRRRTPPRGGSVIPLSFQPKCMAAHHSFHWIFLALAQRAGLLAHLPVHQPHRLPLDSMPPPPIEAIHHRLMCHHTMRPTLRSRAVRDASPPPSNWHSTASPSLHRPLLYLLPDLSPCCLAL
jgi:hypothetical protein